MNFELSEEQKAFAKLATAFASNELEPSAGKWDREEIFPIETIRKAGTLGLCGLYSPQSFGGLDLSRLSSSIIFECLAQGCTSTTAFLTIHNMATWMVCKFGTDSTLKKWASALTSGQALASYCLTEPNAGSDAGALATKATWRGSHYELNGGKIYSSGAGETDILVVMARTGSGGASGISAFAIDADSNGISFGRKEKKMGWNSQPTRSISFEDVEVPATALLGKEGQGFKIAMQGLDGGRINIASCSIGAAQAAFEKASEHIKERKQFGKSLSDFQALRFKLASMNTNLVASRQMVRLAASHFDNDHPDKTTYCAMAKQFATEACFTICDEALQLFGGAGYIKEYPLERYVRDTRVHRILEGTTEIMKHIISNRILIKNTSHIL